ncbi:MAG: hypothetical protein ABSB59_16370 [Streptosporangiaceae bacterium]|jgi:hypothetical protein
MATRPHDITDLYLAPVVLAVDARIEELGRLDRDGLAYEVALESDSPDFTRAMREDALIRTVTHMTDLHAWEFSWDERGLRLTHETRTFVLGIPAVFRDYLADTPKA